MLVLSRKPGESIHLGDNIVVTVLEAKGNQVRLGITAPREVSVQRSELPDRKSQFSQAAQSAMVESTPTAIS